MSEALDNRGLRPYVPIALARRDGSEAATPLTELNARDAEFEAAAKILVAHALRACLAEAQGDSLKLRRLILDQAEAFLRAHARLKIASVDALRLATPR